MPNSGHNLFNLYVNVNDFAKIPQHEMCQMIDILLQCLKYHQHPSVYRLGLWLENSCGSTWLTELITKCVQSDWFKYYLCQPNYSALTQPAERFFICSCSLYFARYGHSFRDYFSIFACCRRFVITFARKTTDHWSTSALRCIVAVVLFIGENYGDLYNGSNKYTNALRTICRGTFMHIHDMGIQIEHYLKFLQTMSHFADEQGRQYHALMMISYLRISVSSLASSPIYFERPTAKKRILVHFNDMDRNICLKIVEHLTSFDYLVEQNYRPWADFSHVAAVICCLSHNYEKDCQRRAELQRMFKAQVKIICITIQQGFRPNESSLQHIIENSRNSGIDSVEIFDNMKWMNRLTETLHNSLSNAYQGRNHQIFVFFSSLYQWSQDNACDSVRQLLLRTEYNLLYSIYSTSSSVDRSKVLQYLHKINQKLHFEADQELALFEIWLSEQNGNQRHNGIVIPNDQAKLEQIQDNLYFASKHNVIGRVREILETTTMSDLHRAQVLKRSSSLHIASFYGHEEIVRLLLDYGDCPWKRNKHGYTSREEARSESIKQIFSQYEVPPLSTRFDGDLLEWMLTCRDPIAICVQIRRRLCGTNFKYRLERIHKIYLSHYLPLDGFSSSDYGTVNEHFCDASYEENAISLIKAYTSTTSFYKHVNRHLAVYALAYFDSTFNTSLNYSLIHYVLEFVALVIHDDELKRLNFTGRVFRGMLLTQDDLYKYVVGSRIINTTFLSTSKDPSVAEAFIDLENRKHYRQTPEKQSIAIPVLCSYRIRNKDTAFDISTISAVKDESEVLILPFSAFQISRVVRTETITKIDLEECERVEPDFSDEFDQNFFLSDTL